MPVISKLEPEPNPNKDARIVKNRKDVGRKKMIVRGKKEEDALVKLKPTVKLQKHIEFPNTTEPGKIRKRCTVTEPMFAAKPDLYRMPGQGQETEKGDS